MHVSSRISCDSEYPSSNGEAVLYPLNNLLSSSHLFMQSFIHSCLFHALDEISDIYFIALSDAL